MVGGRGSVRAGVTGVGRSPATVPFDALEACSWQGRNIFNEISRQIVLDLERRFRVRMR
jgi:hypothetical protein